MDPIGPLDMPLVRHEDGSNYVLRLAILVEHAETVRGSMELEACCLDRLYNRYYLIRDPDAWSWELDFELQDWRGLACRL